MKQVSDLTYSVSGMLSGLNVNNVTDLNGALERAARTLVQKADIPEASGTQNITLYSGVLDYPVDTRIFGAAINDIRPQGVSRPANNFVRKTNQEDFDRTKEIQYPSGTLSTFEWNNGTPIIRIKSPFPVARVPFSNLTLVASGTASTPVVDTAVFYQSPSSYRLTIMTGTGTLVSTFQSPIDLSSYEGVGVGFLPVLLPSGTVNLTSVTINLGSDNSNYASVASTAQFLGAFEAGDWFLVPFDFASATNTGTPDWTSIDYFSLSFVAAADITNIRISIPWISLPSQNQILYQSSAIFLPIGSQTTQENISANDNYILLNPAAYNIYLYECALAVLENTGASSSDATSTKFSRLLNGDRDVGDIGLYARYRGDNPSEEIRTSGEWYSNERSY